MTTLEYIDTAGETQTLDSANYDVDTDAEPARIKPAYGLSWPSTRDVIQAVILTYKAGYASADDVPEDIKHAIKLLVGHWYVHRESVSSLTLKEMPQAAKSLLWPGRVF